MKRTTIMLSEQLHARAAREAKRKGVSFAHFVRLALQSALGRSPSDDPLYADDAVFMDDGPRDLAADHDRYL